MNNFQVEVNLQSENKITRWNIFFFTFILIFALTILQSTAFKNFKLASPLPLNNSVFNRIIPKLEEKSNNYKIIKPTSVIESSYASTIDLRQVNSYAAINYDTGEVISEKNISKKFPIASLTKIMTAIVALDLTNSNEEITISKNSTLVEPTAAGLIEGEKMTVEELLNAMLLTSANDAAQALKDGIDKKYSSPVFIKAMNEKAKFLGLKNSSFANPQGFDDRKNFSSAEDLAIISHYALTNYPIIEKIVKKDYQFISADKNHKQFDLYNWNGLIGVYPGVKGIKIGNTQDAGNTTIVFSEREGKRILAVILGAPGILERDLWASEILDAGFKKLANLTPVNVTESDLRQKYGTWKYWN